MSIILEFVMTCLHSRKSKTRGAPASAVVIVDGFWCGISTTCNNLNMVLMVVGFVAGIFRAEMYICTII